MWQIILGVGIALVVVCIISIEICILPMILKSAAGMEESKAFSWADRIAVGIFLSIGFCIYLFGEKPVLFSYVFGLVFIIAAALIEEVLWNKGIIKRG